MIKFYGITRLLIKIKRYTKKQRIFYKNIIKILSIWIINFSQLKIEMQYQFNYSYKWCIISTL